MEPQAVDENPRIEDAERLSDELVFWWSSRIEDLRREGRMAEALLLAWAAMEAVQEMRPLPYGWAWGVAVIARQMRWYDLEMHVIERVLTVAAQGGTAADRWESRLSTARALASRNAQR